MAVTGNVRKRIRVSKNRKRNWNKTCDIKDVEEFLEEERFNERIGGAVSKKANEELFFIQASTECPEAVKDTNTEGLKAPEKINLKCYPYIGVYSNVPPAVDPNTNKYPKRIQRDLEHKIKKKVKHLTKEVPKTAKPDKVLKDIWGDNEEKIDDEIKDLITFHDEITKKRRPNVPRHRFVKPSLLPSVEVPHPGASYNPSFSDHQDLIKKAVSVEEEKIKEELHLKRVLHDMFPTADKAPTQETLLAEMSQGLFEDNDEGETEDNGYLFRNPPVSAEDRLTKSRKRKRKEMKTEARLRALEKQHKKQMHEIYRLPSIKKELNKKNRITIERQKKKFERKVEKMYQPRTLSQYKYEAPDIEVNLTEELTGSLRNLKCDGNLLEDRYKSLQRRNLIEPRIPQKVKRKYKRKLQVKRGHRNFE